MSLIVRTACWLVVAFVAAPLALLAQGTPATGTVRGRVTEAASGQPIPGVQAQVVGTTLGAATGETGEFTITGVPAGNRVVLVRRIGYAEARLPVQVAAGQTSTVNATLTAAAVMLSEVVTTGTAVPSVRASPASTAPRSAARAR
jgi:hypothetical protein